MIEVRGLTKKFGDHKAVDDLSFNVQPGIVTGFLGPNGAGKSTTMRLMLDLDHGSGTTTFDGKKFHEIARPMRVVGVLLEAKAFHPTRTARNHLRMLAAPSHVPDKRVDEVLELVGLTSVANKKPKSFSLGMGQRLGLAAALLGDPEIILLDEPANGLDPQGITWLRDLLKAFAQQGKTVFASSHLLSEMALLADHLVVIGRGRLLADLPMSEFVAQSSHTSVIVRTPHYAKLSELLSARGVHVSEEPYGRLSLTGIEQDAVGELAFAEGMVLHELTTRTATLEEAFLEATAGAEEFQGGQLGGVA
ncbi:MAG: type transport system ATP-binding protein [Frankiales bacterium]|nr:type transport system ATP-binding protein [Frankiales bacterium]MDX6210577.1 type transport system ATP-binding protein [Frankiales bacterium]MDX6213250.1 type transport system ATP-binding protein [Frankiales bacterium]MDX6222566.1 type transport system ATP-binding protein [Frankiales bacterium]